MKWKMPHHPDVSIPVVRRKASDELITLLEGTAALLLSRGASEIYGHCYPNKRAFNASINRLEKKGLVVKPQTDGSFPRLELTPAGENSLPAYYNPQAHWSKPWNQWWYVLMFDVPETERHYRNTLRTFLKRLRFGCLQKSVWVSPRDVRPEYDDLDRAAAVDSVAFLFEAKTVLNYGKQSVVQEAWNFGRLYEIQNSYMTSTEQNLSQLCSGKFSEHELVQLLRLDNLAYSQAMVTDPLLPNELLPKNYLGKDLLAQHREISKQATEHLLR